MKYIATKKENKLNFTQKNVLVEIPQKLVKKRDTQLCKYYQVG